MKIKYLLGVALAAVSLSSCLNNDSVENVQTENISGGITFTIDNTTNAAVDVRSTSFQIKTDVTNLTLGCVLPTLNVPGSTPLPNAIFSDLKLISNDTGWMLADGSNLRPEVEGFSDGAIPLFESIRIAAINHSAELDGQTIGGYERVIRMRSGNYTIFYTPSQGWSTGTTNVTDRATGEVATCTTPIYLLTVDASKKTATITIYNAAFTPGMEKKFQTMRLADVPVSFMANGTIRLLLTEEFTPYLLQGQGSGQTATAAAEYTISNLTCNWDLFSGIDIAFDCTTDAGSYHVYADMPFNKINL